ncbi:IgGFc-binding protein-like [Saccostrea echinata]|uniref:IgGFc-binding protein-like n=1 Tax=Saccostrea echinata TaxID=191078 RepID=UPI002A82BEFA|nr:IgGFc-binding protein-like [Saccostrea echinata]
MANRMWVFLLLALPFVKGALDSKGKQFIVTFMDNKILQNTDINPEIFITTSSTKPVHVNVTSPGSSNPRINEHFVVSRGIVHRVVVDQDFRLNHTELSTKGILISADEEVVAYGVNREVWSDDAYLALPTDVLGKEYYTISYSPSYYYCEFAVIGVHDHTKVHIKLANHPNVSVIFRNHTYQGNDWINVTLNRYSTLQITSVGDLTGTHIISNKAIGVISGNKKAVVGTAGPSRDHLTEMLLPVQAWGKNFATVPIPERAVGDIFRFVASQDHTHITVTGVINGKNFTDHFNIAHAGGYRQRNYSSALYAHVVSNNPIALYQISATQDRGHNHVDAADPCLITIPPIEQYAADYTFATPQYSKGEYQNYFMFVIDSSQTAGLILDGKPLPQNQTYVHIPGTNLAAGFVNISVGTHTVTHNNPNTVIGGIVFGKAKLESYGFPIGLLTQPVNSGCHAKAMSPGDEVDNDCDGEVDEEDCDGKDDDADGRIDEDCSGTPLTVIGRK